MTREETEKRIAIMQAYVDGKTIEFYDKLNGKWVITETPHWDSASEYRIKPETKYRPFTDVDECWEEMLKHQPFGWVESPLRKRFYLISKIDANGCYFSTNDNISFELFFKVHTFADGTPFGVKEEGA